MASKKRKPSEIRVGHSYRLREPFGNGPGQAVAHVTSIKNITTRARLVYIEWLHEKPHADVRGYGEFLKLVFCEEHAQ